MKPTLVILRFESTQLHHPIHCIHHNPFTAEEANITRQVHTPSAYTYRFIARAYHQRNIAPPGQLRLMVTLTTN